MKPGLVNHLRACAAALGAETLASGILISGAHGRPPVGSIAAIIAGAAVLAYCLASALGSR